MKSVNCLKIGALVFAGLISQACGPAQFGATAPAVKSNTVSPTSTLVPPAVSSPGTSSFSTENQATRVASPTLGICGSANNIYPDPFASSLSAGSLCAVGSPTAFTNSSGVFTWQCTGSGGGESVSCSTKSCLIALLEANISLPQAAWLCAEYRYYFNRNADVGGAVYWNANGLFNAPPSCQGTILLAGTSTPQDCEQYRLRFGQRPPAAFCGGVQATSCP